jgi:beta-lactamase superfamily II metal-dependent hydrolase
MKLTVLPSGHGDCLLLESGGKRMLIDGGVSKAFREEVLPWLAKSAKKPIDCIYVSHIDNDHLGGLIVLLDALYEYKVWAYRKKHNKKPLPKEPKYRPPELVKIWHNVFSDLLGKNAQPVAAALAQTSTILSGLESSSKVKDYHDNLAEGVKEALRISYRVGADQLGLQVNPEYKGALMLLDRKPPKLTLGKADFTLLAPRAEDLENLRKEWNEWLDENEALVRDLRAKASKDADGLSSAAGLIQPMETEARMLAANIDIAFKAEDLGKRNKVTTPNLASLMFLAEEGTQSVLLTGDGHADEVLSGLKTRKKLKAGGTLHVDILKVPHHGAEFNTTPAFAETVTARHYLFCGNGFQGNPETIVLETYVDARKKVGGGKYTFWFNSLPDNAHMKMIKSTVTKLKKEDPNLSFEFRNEPFVVPF